MSDFLKIVELEPYFPTGELTVQPVVLWAHGRPHFENLTKHASVGSEFFKTITPVPGHSIVYVLALGSWESYGENRNGDGFPEFPYREDATPPAIAPEDVLTQHYKTFETFGYNYRHHVNKDPEKAVGKVMKAFWNPTMHRVELLIDLDNAKAPDLAERIASGEFPPVSMGTRVKYDVCTICLNRAPTRAHYCEHLKFQMRDVINGKKVAALNPSPKFFDISWVFRPADATAFMLKKVAEHLPYEPISGAEAGEYLDAMEQQKIAARKLAVLDKIVQGYPVDAKTTGMDERELSNLRAMRPMLLDAGNNTPDLPDDTLRNLSQYSLPQIFSSSMASGMIQLSTPEVTKIIIYKSYPTKNVPSDILDKAVVAQSGILGLLEDCPQILDQLKTSGCLSIGPEYVNDSIMNLFSPYVEKRAGIGEYLKRRFVPETWRNETPYTTPLTITDPVTGFRYGTTRGAAIRAHDEIAKRNLYKVIGGGALLGGAYKLLGHGMTTRGWGKYKPLAALGLGYLGAKHWPSTGPHYMTDQGIPVPVMTEMSKVSSVGAGLGTLGIMAALAHDYQSRLRSGIPLEYPELPLSRRILDKTEQFSANHPLLAAGGGFLALRGAGRTAPAQAVGKWLQQTGLPRARDIYTHGKETAKNILHNFAGGTKISSYLEKDLDISKSAILLPEVDLDKLAEWLGWIIYEG